MCTRWTSHRVTQMFCVFNVTLHLNWHDAKIPGLRIVSFINIYISDVTRISVDSKSI